jgi:hypothetical protein
MKKLWNRNVTSPFTVPPLSKKIEKPCHAKGDKKTKFTAFANKLADIKLNFVTGENIFLKRR